jgi:hypothetical protein
MPAQAYDLRALADVLEADRQVVLVCDVVDAELAALPDTTAT